MKIPFIIKEKGINYMNAIYIVSSISGQYEETEETIKTNIYVGNDKNKAFGYIANDEKNMRTLNLEVWIDEIQVECYCKNIMSGNIWTLYFDRNRETHSQVEFMRMDYWY